MLHFGRGLTWLAPLALMLVAAPFAEAKKGDLPPARVSVARVDTAPTVDGELHADEWRQALRLQPFIAYKGRRFEPRHAEAYVTFTDDRLFIAIVSGVPTTGPRTTKRFRDAQLIYESALEVWIDPSPGEENTPHYQFLGNSGGAIKDLRFEAQGGPDVGWNGDWQYANLVDMEARRWVAELSIPWSEFDWEGQAVGREIGLLIARDFKRNWEQTTWMPMTGAFVNKSLYPRLALTENAPTVRIESVGDEFFGGRVDMRLQVVNPGPARQVNFKARVTSSDMPQVLEEKVLKLPANGERTHRFQITGQRLNADARHTLHLTLKDAKTGQVYLRHEGASWTQPDGPIWSQIDKTDPKRAVRLGYYPSHGIVKLRIDPQWLAADAEIGDEAAVTVTGPNGSEVAQQTVRWDELPTQRRIEVGQLDGGEYQVKIAVAGREKPFVRHFTRKHFAWEGNTLGITDEVFPPFEPMRVEDQTVRVVQRAYEKSGLGLWRQVEAVNEPILADAMSLRVNGDTALEGEGEFETRADDEVVYAGEASHPAVRVNTRTITEYDGCMRVEMDLLPGAKQKQLDSLTLDIPLKDEIASLWHVSTTALRVNPVGAPPKGEGRVWDTRDFPDGEWYGGFRPYIWLGGEKRGLAWFADNDKDWVIDVDPKEGTYDPALSLHRKDGVLTLRVHFVQKPITLEKKRQIVFGLMASPGKPMRDDWRKIGRPDHLGLRFSMGDRFGLGATFNAKYPYNGDFSIFNAVQAGRFGAKLNAKKIQQQWLEDNMAGVPESVRSFFATKVRRGARTATRYDGDGYLSVYFEEFHSTNLYHDEVATFQAEWTGGWNKQDLPRQPKNAEAVESRIRSDVNAASYRDFAVWYGAEWLRRGVGLYFDNTFPRRSNDLITSNAYRLPDGTIQPSAGMWARRKYLKRIWVLHQKLYNERAPHMMMLHMTNTHILPYMVWNESNLDLEWLYTPEPFQSKFAPTLLRAQSLGRQTGNVPLAIAKYNKGESTQKQRKRAHRTRWGGLLVHEIKGRRRATVDRYPEPLIEFGYGLDDCTVYNYWDEQAPLSVSDEQCKWLLLKRDGKLMALMCTWNAEATDVQVTLDLDRLGVTPSRVVNAETGEEVAAVTDGTFQFPMNGYGVRLLRLE